MPTPKRSLTLAVDDEDLRARLAGLLADEAIDVVFVPRAELARMEAVEADAIALHDPDVSHDLLERAQDDDTPGVVVIARPGDERDEARLVAAGASALVDAHSPDQVLRDQVVELVEAESEGGLHGPEGRGSQAEPRLADFHSKSPRMRRFLELVRQVAESDASLLVTGETGVGKERLARAIHGESARASKPFVTVNCGALPSELLESELFGHERGAFTGAQEARVGRFEAADGGTIFLDEIGEMPLELQVKLLTVLQRHEVHRLGARAPRPVDVRVIAATNRDLPEDVREGRFREDLLFRLNVVTLEIPPLRERPEDLPQLVGRFLRHFSEAHEREEIVEVDEDAMQALLAHAWPGNVREVVNVIERAILLAKGPTLTLADLPPALRGGQHAANAAGSAGGAAPAVDDELLELPLRDAKNRLVETFERRYLDNLLRTTGGVVGEVARRARINPRTLYEKMRRYGLDKSSYQDG